MLQVTRLESHSESLWLMEQARIAALKSFTPGTADSCFAIGNTIDGETQVTR
jgi:hypothetical protein